MCGFPPQCLTFRLVRFWCGSRATTSDDPDRMGSHFEGRGALLGQLGGGLQLRLLESPLSGFVRADVRFGDKIDGLAVNVGLRGNFLTQ